MAFRDLFKFNKKDPDDGNFTKIRGSTSQIYLDEDGTRQRANPTTGAAASGATLSTTTTVDSVASSYYSSSSISTVRSLSNDLYAKNPIFQTLIDEMSNLYTFDYVYTPQKVKEGNKDYGEIYSLMGQVVDGMNIETIFPKLIKKMLLDGAVYFGTIKNTSSQTVSTVIFPAEYCRAVALTEFLTYTYQFNFAYFEDLELSEEELENVWEMYPDGMKQQYEDYLADNDLQWQDLDPRNFSCLLLNEEGFPTPFYSYFSIKRYETYQSLQLTKKEQDMDSILTNVIPIYEGEPIMNMEEAAGLHRGIKKKLDKKNKTIDVVTTFSQPQLLSTTKSSEREIDTLEQAFNAVWGSSGMNPALYNDKEGISCSIKRIEASIWTFINSLVNVYSLFINNEYNFGNYQCLLQVLPITIYNQSQKQNDYFQGATLGIGKLQFIVSQGIKQNNIISQLDLEDYLDLDNRIKPFSTAYTQTDNSSGSNTETNEEIKKEEVEN